MYLKQVGIIVYLAHTGSFVPAAAATIGVCDAILSKMRTPKLVQRPVSALLLWHRPHLLMWFLRSRLFLVSRLFQCRRMQLQHVHVRNLADGVPPQACNLTQPVSD